MDQQTPPMSSWPENFNDDSLAPTSGVEDEFSNFLEFDFTFPELENGAVQNPGSFVPPPPTSSMEDVDMMRMSQGQDTQGQNAQTHHNLPSQTMADMSSIRREAKQQHYQDPNFQQQFYSQGQQQQQSHQQSQQQPQMNPNYPPRYHGIPPTPNSIELHGGAAARYPTRMESEARGYEHYARTNDDQVRTFFDRKLSREYSILIGDVIECFHPPNVTSSHPIGYPILPP